MAEAIEFLAAATPQRVGRPASLRGPAIRDAAVEDVPAGTAAWRRAEAVTAVFAEVFRVAAGHTLQEVRRHPHLSGGASDIWEWEHEEYDDLGLLVAAYESWTRGPLPLGAHPVICLVKHSPFGWLLQNAGPPRP